MDTARARALMGVKRQFVLRIFVSLHSIPRQTMFTLSWSFHTEVCAHTCLHGRDTAVFFNHLHISPLHPHWTLFYSFWERITLENFSDLLLPTRDGMLESAVTEIIEYQKRTLE